MTTVKVRELYNKRPFRPFVLHLADGEKVTVEHPEWMSFSPSGRTVIVEHRDDSFDVVDLLLVTRLEVKSNGKSKAHK